MYNTRLLPPDEWYKLDSKSFFSLDDAHTNVMVIEKDGVIIAHWCLVPIYHAECVWVAEDHRGNPVVAKRLLLGMKTMANQVGANIIITTSTSADVSKILEKLEAEKLVGEHWVISFGR